MKTLYLFPVDIIHEYFTDRPFEEYKAQLRYGIADDECVVAEQIHMPIETSLAHFRSSTVGGWSKEHAYEELKKVLLKDLRELEWDTVKVLDYKPMGATLNIPVMSKTKFTVATRYGMGVARGIT